MKYIFNLLLTFSITIFNINYYNSQSWEPKGQTNQIIKHSFYTLSYSAEHKQAEWVQYTLKPHLFNPTISRSDNFREDPLVKNNSAQLKDYKGSGYDRGHLAPAGDMKYNTNAMSESFYLSNMSPQKPSFNRQIWRMIENKFRDWASEYGELIVITGGVLEKECLDTIGENNITVPKYYYKVAIDPANYSRNIAILIENKNSKQPIMNYVISVDSLENFTGINFFHNIDFNIQNEIESKTHINLWNWGNKFQPKYNNNIINTQADSIERINSIEQLFKTKSGKKFHIENCRYLKRNNTPISIIDLKKLHLSPCKVCKPNSEFLK
ncbi:MAG: DNA/RNA non-specific endonuclease [Flavobacteriales bacterium]|nr:DNA/RNA non-specific endonuclease [Flavobacteriales bacterium]